MDRRWFHKNEYLLSVTLPTNCYFKPRCTNKGVLMHFIYMYIIYWYFKSFGSHFIGVSHMYKAYFDQNIQYISNINYLWVVQNTIEFQFHLCLLETCHIAYFNNTVNQTKMCGMLLSTAFKNAFVNEIMWCNIIIIRD